MANIVASVLPRHERAMSFLAHLEELRRRIIFSILGILVGFLLCWSFADRLFGLMQQPNYSSIAASWHRRGLGVPKSNRTL